MADDHARGATTEDAEATQIYEERLQADAEHIGEREDGGTPTTLHASPEEPASPQGTAPLHKHLGMDG